jgi:Tfp pilus assembly protein PilX
MQRKQRCLLPLHRQSGVALIIGLIFLVLMSIISLTAMNNVTIQEQINGNTVHKNTSFQQAEQDLADAEELVLAVNIATQPYVINVLHDNSLALTDDDLLIATNWDCNSTANDKKCRVEGQSRVKIEYLSDTNDEHKFRVTVRTEIGRSVVTLQSIYKR